MADKPVMSLMGYKETNFFGDDFDYSTRGWGCGYIHFPQDHPMAIFFELNDYGTNINYAGFTQEISYCNIVNGWWKVGFDTNRRQSEHCTKEWVEKETRKMYEVVINFGVKELMDLIADIRSDINSNLNKIEHKYIMNCLKYNQL